MYLNILKKDLRRKKAMNTILLIFIILATMFVSSGANNIISVTSALDHYLEMADVPDYAALVMNKAMGTDVEKYMENLEVIDRFQAEEVIYMSDADVIRDGEPLTGSMTSLLLQSDRDFGMNYLFDDGSALESVPKGSMYITEFLAERAGLKIGDTITVNIEGVSREFTFAGTFKDAVFGTESVGIARFIINDEDFEEYRSDEAIWQMYGGAVYFIHTGDMDKLLSELSDISENFVLTGDRALIKFSYVFNMVITGVLLVVSLILIIVALVVLRFVITFTLSEEFREIGVMKAIGIRNMKIRGLYLIKYVSLAVAGAAIGLALSFPFGRLLMSVSSKSVIMSNQNVAFINVICTVFVIGIILLFCFGCTGKVKKMMPIDAIRSGQTGERFRKKSLMSLSRSRLHGNMFLALNDIVSSPKRYGIITLAFVLCLSLLLVLSTTVATMKSGRLLSAFSLADCDIIISNNSEMQKFMTEGGREALIQYLDGMEADLSVNGMPAECMAGFAVYFSVRHDGYKSQIMAYQDPGAAMDMYDDHIGGTVPRHSGEIAITRLAADRIKADIGDTVTVTTLDGEKEYLITEIYQSMQNRGVAIRLHPDEEVDYAQMSVCVGFLIKFTDAPGEEEISRRIEKIKELYPQFTNIRTSVEWVEDSLSVTDTMNAVKIMSAALTVLLAALVTVLMERSFIAKEQGEIALMKAVGIRNGGIYAYHTARFAAIGVITVVIAEIFAMPLTHLCIDPIFKMMGLELAIRYCVSPLEMYLILPLVLLITTTAGAYLTSLYTRKIKPSDTANID